MARTSGPTWSYPELSLQWLCTSNLAPLLATAEQQRAYVLLAGLRNRGLMEFQYKGAALALPFFLAACGGDSGGSGSPPVTQLPPSPTPTPAPTPGPTPTPSGSDATLLTLTAATQLVGFTADSGFVQGPDGTITYTSALWYAPGAPVVFDPASGSINYVTNGFHVQGISDLGTVSLRQNSSASTPSFITYSGAKTGVSITVQQLRMGPTNPTLPLNYSSIAYVRAVYRNTSTGEILNGVVPFSFGIIFDSQIFMPTGAATYEGLIVGHALRTGGRDAYDLSGRFRIDLNYDTLDASGYIDLTGTNEQTGETVTFERVPLRDTKIGSLSHVSLPLEYGRGGDTQAFLAGARAQEIMGAFVVSVEDPNTPGGSLRATGAFAGKK